jgi:hypothetical protein
MRKEINEAFFWKYLADAFIEHLKIDKKSFYGRVKSVKSVWDIEDIDRVSKDLTRAAKDKTLYVKESFGKIISDSKAGNLK